MKPDMQTVQMYFMTYDIPFGPDEDIIMLADYFTEQSIEQGQKELAQYFLSILVKLFGDDIDDFQELQEKIDKM